MVLNSGTTVLDLEALTSTTEEVEPQEVVTIHVEMVEIAVPLELLETADLVLAQVSTTVPIVLLLEAVVVAQLQ